MSRLHWQQTLCGITFLDASHDYMCNVPGASNRARLGIKALDACHFIYHRIDQLN